MTFPPRSCPSCPIFATYKRGRECYSVLCVFTYRHFEARNGDTARIILNGVLRLSLRLGRLQSLHRGKKLGRSNAIFLGKALYVGVHVHANGYRGLGNRGCSVVGPLPECVAAGPPPRQSAPLALALPCIPSPARATKQS